MLNGIAQGLTPITRNGRQVRIRNVYIRGSVEPAFAGSGTSDATFCTAWLIWDKNPRGATLTANDFLQYGDGAGHPSTTFMNMSNSDRFVILKRESWTLGPASKGGASNYMGDPTTGKIDWALDVDLVTTYQGTGAGIAAVEAGGLVFAFCSDNATGDGWKCNWHARWRFEDC